jgi:hypothetical protein
VQRGRVSAWNSAVRREISTALPGCAVSRGVPAALILYDPVLNDTDYILGTGDDTRITVGALLKSS